MKNLFKGLVALSLLVGLNACQEDTDGGNENPETGTLKLQFENFIGADELVLSSDTTNYLYTNGNSQGFNINKLGYYITNVKLEGPNGEVHLDAVISSANASEVSGFYHCQQSEAASQLITIQDIPVGYYNKVTFDLGIPEASVQQGAQGGILDVAEGAWFWNWNAGYIGFAIEGVSDASPQAYVDWGGGDITPKYSYEMHIGGWKDSDNMVNNVQTVTLTFPSEVEVADDLSPKAHIVVDVLKMINMAAVDFSTDYAVHSPSAGAPFAMHLGHMFMVEHVHQ